MAPLGMHGQPLRPRSQETLAKMAESARVMTERVEALRLGLIKLAREGKPPKVLTWIEAQGWVNDRAIGIRFKEIHGYTPKVYANAFRSCGWCGSIDLLDGCAGCLARAKIQGPEADIPFKGLTPEQCVSGTKVRVWNLKGFTHGEIVGDVLEFEGIKSVGVRGHGVVLSMFLKDLSLLDEEGASR